MIGLWKAINRYDYDKFSNQSFSTYATYLIDNEINNVPSSFSTTTIGNEKKIKQIKAVEKRLLSQLNRQPSDEEIANEIGGK